MKAICEVCGLFSMDKNACSICGEKILTVEEISMLPSAEWGGVTFRLGTGNSPAKQAALQDLRDKLTSLEEFTFLKLMGTSKNYPVHGMMANLRF